MEMARMLGIFIVALFVVLFSFSIVDERGILVAIGVGIILILATQKDD